MNGIVSLNALLTVGDLLRVIAVGHERTAIVVDDNNRLHGVVSQGDLLKALWNGASILDPANKVINPNPLMIVDGSNEIETALNLFLEHGALMVPVVDQDRKLLRVINVRDAVMKILGGGTSPKFHE